MEPKTKIGDRYGHLVVIGEAEKESNGQLRYKCQCDCGNIIITRGTRLRNGEKKSCGKCLYNRHHGFVDLTGEKFGKITVLEYVGQNKNRYSIWKCQCECGVIKNIDGHDLRRGKIRSCNCSQDSQREFFIRTFLEENNIKYIKEYSFSDLKTSKGGYPRFDFAIFLEDKLYCLLEYQGEQHYKTSNNYFGIYEREVTDKLKKEYCKKKNIPFYEIKYDEDVQQKLQEILEKFLIG